jgi:hypothetical protein
MKIWTSRKLTSKEYINTKIYLDDESGEKNNMIFLILIGIISLIGYAITR